MLGASPAAHAHGSENQRSDRSGGRVETLAGPSAWEGAPQAPAAWQTPLTHAAAPDGARVTGPRGRASADDSTITYDVVVFGLDTPTGPHRTTAAESRSMVERLDDEYAAETGGRYRFAFHSFRELPAAGQESCDVLDLNRRYRPQIDEALAEPHTAADRTTWVFVTAGQDCSYAGQAVLGSAGVHMNGYWRPKGPNTDPGPDGWPKHLDVSVLAHEVGHNLGLAHAGGLLPEGRTAPLDGQFSVWEYGDWSDTMGSNDFAHRFNSLTRDVLGLLPPSAVGAVATSGSFRLAPLDAASGTRMLVIPSQDSRSYLVEYRPALGRDWPMRFQTEAEDDAGPGVYVRLMTRADETVAGLTSGDFDSVALPTASSPEGYVNAHLGHQPGDFVDLPGGTRLTFGSQDDGSAQVTVTRPADVAAPKIALDLCADAFERAGSTSCTLDGGGRPYRLQLVPGARMITEDTWTASLTVQVNGSTALDLSSSPAITHDQAVEHADAVRYGAFPDGHGGWTDLVRIPVGTNTVTVTATDLAGNRTVRSWTITNPAPAAPSRPSRPELVQKGPLSILSTWSTTEDADGYRVQIQRNNGPWRSLGRAARPRKKIAGLRPGATYRVRVAAFNANGASGYATSRRLRLHHLAG
jgi:hypothetical protein